MNQLHSFTVEERSVSLPSRPLACDPQANVYNPRRLELISAMFGACQVPCAPNLHLELTSNREIGQCRSSNLDFSSRRNAPISVCPSGSYISIQISALQTDIFS